MNRVSDSTACQSKPATGLWGVLGCFCFWGELGSEGVVCRGRGDAFCMPGRGRTLDFTRRGMPPPPLNQRRPRLAERPTLLAGEGARAMGGLGPRAGGNARAARGGNGRVPPACGGEINAAKDARCSEQSEQMLSFMDC